MNKINWISISGIAYANDANEILFESRQYSQSQIRCNQFFRSGTIEFDVQFKHADVEEVDNKPLLAIVGLNYETTISKLYFGISSQGAYTISQNTTVGVNERKTAAVIDEMSRLRNISHHVKITITGSEAKMLIDGVLVCKADNIITTLSQITLSLEGCGDICVKNFKVETVNVKAFVIMDFNEKYSSVYTEIIKPVCENLGIECIRADEQCFPGTIIQDIIESIKECDIIIADITPDNPNVYFEVGYAYALGKNPILLMNKSREKLPFDVSGFRMIMYTDSIQGAPNLKQQLTKFVKALLDR